MRVTIYQDTYCPWCYIGKKNFEQAIQEFDGEVEVEYKSFFLRPDTPKEGMSKDEYMMGRYNTETIEKMENTLKEKSKQAGIDMNLDNSVIPNTELSHRLGKLYPDKKEALISSYYEAYFEEGKDIGNINTLLEIAESLGIDREEAEYLLVETDKKRQEVWDDYEEAQKIGVRGVPFFVFNNEQALQGAHEPDMILQVMERVRNREDLQLELMK